MTTLISALEGAKKPVTFPTAIKDSAQSFNEGLDAAIAIVARYDWKPASNYPKDLALTRELPEGLLLYTNDLLLRIKHPGGNVSIVIGWFGCYTPGEIGATGNSYFSHDNVVEWKEIF